MCYGIILDKKPVKEKSAFPVCHSSNASILHPVAAARKGVDSIEIHWNRRADGIPVSVFRGDSPDRILIDYPLVQVEQGCSILLSGLKADRPHFFKLVTGNGVELIIGERRPVVEGAPNLRDLGGYETEDGRRVKWGRIFRSSNLGRLTDKGLGLVKRLGIKLVCDFRTDAEARKLPNRFPDSTDVGYLRLPIQHGDFEPTAVFERIRNGDYDWISEEFMLQGYIESIDRFPQVWAALLNRLSDSANQPLLFHCTGGKDRTGTAAALILSALRVPEQTVVEDFGLSDGYNAEARQKIYAYLRPLGVDILKVEPYFTAPPIRLRTLLTYIGDHYGSPEKYLLQEVGVTERVMQRLREGLLE
jgi:protein-tyrosine phosphatase